MKFLALLLAASVASALPHGPDEDMDMHAAPAAAAAPKPAASKPAAPIPAASKPADPPAVVTLPKGVNPPKSAPPQAVNPPPAAPAAPATAQIGSGSVKTKTPAGCTKIASDNDFPTEAEWKKALPDVIPRSQSLKNGVYRPDYWLRAESTKDVQDAVKFVAKHKLRLSVINSGHDFLGRNDAPTGLTLDVSLLKGITVLNSFEPTAQGAAKPAKQPNVITPASGKQAAVTIGVAVMTQELNNVLAKSKLVSVGAAHGSVCPAGGFGQTAGHSPISNRYGLGSDQFLEFKVVTADGELKVANKVANQDLFWALRGGGGGTFGVVVQATIKAHPDIPITTSVWQINTTSPNSDGLWQSYALLHTHFVDLVENNSVSGYYYIYPNSIKATFLHQAEHSGKDNAKKIWEPILLKMSTFPNMMKATLEISEFPSFKGYFDARFGAIDGGPGKKEKDPWDTTRAVSLERRHGPGEMDMSKPPTPNAMANLDSRLLGAEAFAHPNLTSILKAAAPFALGPQQSVVQGHLVAGGKVAKPDDDTSTNPAWRKAYVHTIGYRDPGKASVDSLRALAPNSGAYSNEAFPLEENWKQSFWGSNYQKLSQIKTKYDPNMLFWVTPGINADLREVRDHRVCELASNSTVRLSHVAPRTDNLNSGRVLSGSIN